MDMIRLLNMMRPADDQLSTDFDEFADELS